MTKKNLLSDFYNVSFGYIPKKMSIMLAEGRLYVLYTNVFLTFVKLLKIPEIDVFLPRL